jgi:hypothetical protein
VIICPGEKRASHAGLICDGAGSEPPDEGVTASVAVLLVPLYVAVIVDEVDDVTDVVVVVKLALVDPAFTVMLAGTDTAGELSDNATTTPPAGAALDKVTVPVELFPPTTLVGLIETDESVGVGVADCTVKDRTVENGPLPPELIARTRHHSCCAGRLPIDTCELMTVIEAISGALIELELSIWIS